MRFGVVILSLGLSLLAAPSVVSAQSAQNQPASTSVGADTGDEILLTPEDQLDVFGARKGPRLWRVSKTDASGKLHEGWILGTVNSLPKGVTWDSSDVEKIIREADEILPYSVTISFSPGPLKAIGALMQINRIKKIDDKQKLRDIVPQDLYARFATLRKEYGRSDDAWENLRPTVAAAELASEGFEHAKLNNSINLGAKINAIAKKQKKKLTLTSVKFTGNIKATLQAADKVSREAELKCFAGTLDLLEKTLPNLRARARAWAIGDVKRLRELRPNAASVAACTDLLVQVPELQKLRDDGVEKARNQLIKSLNTNASTFSYAAIETMLSPNSDLYKRLRAEGFTIEGP